MKDEIMMKLNDNVKARKLKQAFEEFVATSNLTSEEIEEKRKTMIMMAMTLVPETIDMMSEEVYESINS